MYMTHIIHEVVRGVTMQQQLDNRAIAKDESDVKIGPVHPYILLQTSYTLQKVDTRLSCMDEAYAHTRCNFPAKLQMVPCLPRQAQDGSHMLQWLVQHELFSQGRCAPETLLRP